MTFLPIVARELRVAARRSSTYWMRTLLGLTVCVVWLIMLATATRGIPASEVGKVLFSVLGGIALGFSLFAGVFLTADSLSEERREGTLGLLFLTELRGYDVVFGKLIATSLPAVYGLLTIFPVLAVPLLMGGVSLGEFWRVVLALLATLALSLCIGMTVSAFCRDARQAMSTTLLLLILFSGIMPLLGWSRDWWWNIPPGPFFLWPSPGYLFGHAFDNYYRWGGTANFWGSLATVAGLSVVALTAANLRLPHAWQEGGDGRIRREVGGWMGRLRFGGESFRAARRRRLEDNPFYWLATRDRQPPWLGSAAAATLWLFWLALFCGSLTAAVSKRDIYFAISIPLAIGLHLVVKWSVTTESSRRFSEDRRSGALELLLVTPLTGGRIIEGQRRALDRAFIVPAAFAAVTNLAYLWMLYRANVLRIGSRESPTFCELFVGGLVLLLADIWALRWVGMWMGLRARNHQRAVLATLGRILLLPWLALLFVWFLGVSGSFNSPDDALVIFFIWHAFSVVLDVAFAVRARRALGKELKAAAIAAPVHNPSGGN